MPDHHISALVTGANSGIGREVARQLAAAGHTVHVGSRDAARGREAVRDIGGDPAEAAAGVVRLALLGDDGPTGGFFSWDGSPVPW